MLVQRLQQAKLELLLPAMLKKLDRYDLLVIDDLGYVKKSETETSVLFELIAYRYERKSLLITANQPFSQWHNISADDMMTVAAVDRLVHHALIVEILRRAFGGNPLLKALQKKRWRSLSCGESRKSSPLQRTDHSCRADYNCCLSR